MLEGVVARLLNRWLGKYVIDLDTENLNVGIFSGQVQLTDLRLKPEALYELDLPIEVKFGTIGKICIQIPWSALINQPVIIHVEDVHILAEPVLANSPYDSEKDKRLIRAAKRKALADLDEEADFIGGPNSFPEHLITSIINNLQVVVQNIHVRYEDNVSTPKPLVAGLCISSITAETTNNKWKASSTPKGCSTGYLLLKMESFSVYWNTSCEPQKWDWRTQYYTWRNLMTHSLQTFSINNVDFDFLIKPMTCKIKVIINKSNGTNILKLLVDIMLQDFTLQLSREQYLSLSAVIDSMKRMLISRQFLSKRPTEPVLKDLRGWWRYAHNAVLLQRVRPFTWSKVISVRSHYRLYRDTYKKLLVNPNDTELKLDLQKYEDNLSLINIVIAREHAKKILKIEQPDFEIKDKGLNDKGRSLWSMLPSPERGYLCKMIGYVETPKDTKTPYHCIEHKYNITIGNFTLSLMNEGHEILAVTLTQVLASAETKPSIGTYKFSGRAEGLVIEGASIEDHLVPLINAEHTCNGSMSPNVISIDYEQNSSENVNSKLWGSLEAIEAVFHAHAVAELLKFLENGPLFSPLEIMDYMKTFVNHSKKLFCEVLNRRIDVNLDLKIPYLVIPEFGCITKPGNFIILDLGRLVIRTELAQPSENLEEATQMELEEQLYSRLHIDLFHMQFLFCDSSENWRDARKEIDTELHLMSKLNMFLVYSKCIKSEYKVLSKDKLTITIPSFKINISERKITLLLVFVENLGEVIETNLKKHIMNKLKSKVHWPKDMIVEHWSPSHLLHITRSVSVVSESAENDKRRFSEVSEIEAFIMGHSDPSVEPSEYSEDTSEAWARCVDLPGLEDNISPHNNIQSLIRVVLGELCIVLSRSSERVDRAYLMLRTGKVCLDLALMDYGPALQLTITCISLTDKLHTNGSGQYLDLIHVPVPCEQDFITVLYRKVRADCPDFRTHFHSVEKSLVADIGPVNFLIHRDAVRTLLKYLQYLCHKIEKYKPIINKTFTTAYKSSLNLVRQKTLDPPVPPGAVKFSYSTRLTAVIVRLCDADCDIMEMRIAGLESDLMFRANERMVLRAYLNSISVDHLADVTLYTKVLTVDEEKVFEMKYVRHSPCLYRVSDITPNNDDISSDGSLKIHLSHVQITVIYKLVLQLQQFFAPLVEVKARQLIVNWLKGTVQKQIDAIRVSMTKLHLTLNIHGPTLLLPQKTASPNLIVVHTGELNLENFFKETAVGKMIVENILLKLEGTTVLRAVMTLASSLEMQEVMLEPMSFRFDIKHTISCPRSANSCVSKALSWEIDGIVDVIKITLGQRDLTTLLAVYSDNINEGHFVEFSPDTLKSSLESSAAVAADDQVVKSLEAFFFQGDAKTKDISVRVNLEGLQLSLFSDCEEVLSSPVRDLNQGLCKLEMGETLASIDVYTDGSLEAKFSVQNLFVEDIRPDSNPHNNKIFQTHRSDTKTNNYQISVSRPPVIDVSFHQNQMGDCFIDAIVERVCLTLSVPFLINLSRFVFESLPCERKLEGGVINHGYVGDPNPTEEPAEIVEEKKSPGMTMALRICKPELVFLADINSDKKIGFITKTELLIDYSRHAMRENLIISISNLHVLYNCLKSARANEPYVVLHPCDFEFTKCFRAEDGVKATATVSGLQLHICSGVVHTLTDVLEDLTKASQLSPSEIQTKHCYSYWVGNKDKEDELLNIWSPKKLSQCYAAEPEEPAVVSDQELNINETFIGSASNISVVLELEGLACTFPVVLIQSSLETTIHNWSHQLHGACEFHLQANYYNETVEKWEPLIEPVVCSENVYRPWEVLVKIFQDSSSSITDGYKQEKETLNRKKSKTRPNSGSSSSDEDVSDDGMTFMRPLNSDVGDKVLPHLKSSLAAFLEDFDSETEDGTMEKLSSAICDLFTGDWNENEDSDCGHSSGTDQSGESDSEEKRKNNRAKTLNAHEIMTDRQATYVLIDSRDTLNITLTSQSVKLFYDIMVAYTNRSIATSTVTLDKSIILINDIGPESRVELLRKSDGENENVIVCSKTFEKLDSGPSSPSRSVDDLADLSTMESVDSASSDIRFHTMDSDWDHDKDITATLQFPTLSANSIYQSINQESLKIEVPGFKPISTVCPKKTWKKLLNLEPSLKNQKYYLLAQHSIHNLNRTLVVSSPLQIRNETCYPLGVFYDHSVLENLGLQTLGVITNPFEINMRIVVIEPQDSYNVPLHVAYQCKLYVQPADSESHHVCKSGLWWPELAADLGTIRNFHCEPKSTGDSKVFAFRVRTEEGITCTRQQSRLIPNYLIRILPPLCLHNCLPFSVYIYIPEIDHSLDIDSGDNVTCYYLNLLKVLKLTIKVNYLGIVWTAMVNITSDIEEKILTLTKHYTGDKNKQLMINIRIDRNESCNIYFYAPYWIVNKTGLPLQLKGCMSNVVYENQNEEPILFFYKQLTKPAVQIRVFESSWSSEFCLDAVGTAGLIVCKDRERNKRFLILLNVNLSHINPRFTKIVTLLPNFLVSNQTKQHLSFMEHNEKNDFWQNISPDNCIAFWPETSSMQMYVKLPGSRTISQNFSIAEVHQTVLRLEKGGAVRVEVNGGGLQPFCIVFHRYSVGDAPVRIENLCSDLFLKVHQLNLSKVILLSPYHSLLYTWDDPTAERTLVWNIYKNKGVGFPVDIHKDGWGEVKICFHTMKPGMGLTQPCPQKVSSSSSDSDSLESEQPTLNKKTRKDKVVVYWLSYMDGLQRTLMLTQDYRIAHQYQVKMCSEKCNWELFLSLSSIGVSLCMSEPETKEFAFLSVIDSPAIWEVNIAHKWKMLTLELASWVEDKYKSQQKKCQLKDYVHIDFEKMYMLKPFYGELRRTYHPALWLQCRRSDTHQYHRFKINSLHIDNELRSHNSMKILYPIVNSYVKSLEVPCIEFCSYKKHRTIDEMDIYKNISLKVTEFYITIDRTFITQFIDVFSPWKPIKERNFEVRSDMTLVHGPLSTIVTQCFSKNRKAIIEHLEISPINLQIGRSSENLLSCKNIKIDSPICDYIFYCLYLTYNPIEHTKYMLPAFEIKHLTSDLNQLLFKLSNHYSSQLLQQFHVHIFGLVVLLNPYEWKTPAVKNEATVCDQTANEIEKVARCLLGHIHGPQYVMSQITGEHLAQYSLEMEHRRRRRFGLSHTNEFPESLVLSNKNFEIGVTLGFQGLFPNSIPGGSYNGAESFFRGSGKALASLMSRSSGGVTDCIAASLDAIRRAILMGERIIIRQRLTRYCDHHLGLVPFSLHEAMGQNLLRTFENGYFADSDVYWCHALLTSTGKSILVVTLQHIFLVENFRLWGPWELEWTVDLDNVISVPKIIDQELVINARQVEGKQTNPDKYTVKGESEILTWLREKIEQALVISMEDKSWTMIEH